MIGIENKLVVLAPLEEIKIQANKVSRMMGLSVDVIRVNEDNAIAVSKEQIRAGKEIIISRGGIAKRIRKNIEVAVIDIEITGYDIMRLLNKYIGKNKKMTVVEIEKIAGSVVAYGKCLGMDIQSVFIEHISDFEDAYSHAINDGAEVIISGSWVISYENRYKIFEERKIVYEIIDSGEEAIYEAFLNAKKFYAMTSLERVKKEEFQTALNSTNEGIVSFDMTGKVIFFNNATQRMFKNNFQISELENLFNEYINQLKTTNKIIKNIVKVINGKEILINIIPIIIEEEMTRVILNFQAVKKLQEQEYKARVKLSERGLIAKAEFKDIVGESSEIRRCIEISKKYSSVNSTILLSGESGTGKEIFAQSIHNYSERRKGPFVAVNCAALPSNLLESELFGYVEGAFTGARRKGKLGLFELAHGGTIFLDEIGELDKKMQTRLLRVLQEKEIMKIGDDKIIPIDVRVITATNKILFNELEEGNFREDLYYRINVLNIKIPALRNRKSDIHLLVNHYINQLTLKNNYRKVDVPDIIMKAFCNHDWRGNIRELYNIVERMVVLAQNRELNNEESLLFVNENFIKISKKDKNESILTGTLDEIEKRIIKEVLEEENFNKTKAAERLGINRTTINRKI